MAASELKLLGGKASTYTNRAMIALNLKSIEYEFVEEDITNKSELLLKSNPVYKKVPILIHAGKPICESLVILQYIHDAWPQGPSILPSEPLDRAASRFWAAYIDDKLQMVPFMGELRQAEGAEAKAEVIEKMHEKLRPLEEAFVKSSNGKAFFFGDNIGYLDIALGCFLGWVRASEIINEVTILDPTKIPGLSAWAESFLSHPAVKDAIPQPEELVALLRMFEAAAKAKAAS